MESGKLNKYVSDKWTKKLYIKNNFPDNYVHETFLNLKKTNGILKLYNLDT